MSNTTATQAACARSRQWAGLMLLGVSAAVINGCSLFSEAKDNAEPPTPLAAIQTEIAPKTLWSARVGERSAAFGGRLELALADDTVYAAAESGAVSAFAARTGALRWRAAVAGSIIGGVAVGDGLVVVSTAAGELVALDQQTGALRWSSPVNVEVLAPAAIADGKVVYRAADGRLAALDAKAGAQVWRFEREAPALSLRGTASPVIDGVGVIAGFDNGVVVRARLADGLAIWERRIGDPAGRTEVERLVDIDAPAVIGDNRIYVVGFQSRTVAMRPDGRAVWRREVSSFRGLALGRRLLFVTDADSELLALDRRSGDIVWQSSALRARNLTRPAAHGDFVVVGDLDGVLHWFSAESGAVVGRAPLPTPALDAAPVVDGDGRLFALGVDGALTALTLN